MIEAKSIEGLQQIISESKTAVKKAIEKNPNVRTVEPGRYEIQGSERRYEIVCGEKPDGSLFIACPCRAGLENKACYHAAAVFIVHARMKKAEKSIQSIRPEDSPYFSGGNSSEKKPEKIGNIGGI